ncbi:MAG: hypothetical protein E7773_11660 [Sphingomonas sp.]|uniref:hypothetical protein n=1 Tax=Sphingomonas sp. TaxID=28214 RepID=UPI001225C87F|nr:hypothetical protein [Sphingomonas sp.]THD35109.1 MAG: hypothetical protein E7773_11660 [Sphingomonas sp.]
MGRRGWILTALGAIGAIVVGMGVASLVGPSPGHKPVAATTAAMVRIDPAPTPTPTPSPIAAVPLARPSVEPVAIATPAPKSRHVPMPHPEQSAAPDVVTVSTINSW